MEKQIIKCSVLLMTLCILNVCIVASELYRWVDENGRVHYSDTPPSDGSAEDISSSIEPMNVMDSFSAYHPGRSVTPEIQVETNNEAALPYTVYSLGENLLPKHRLRAVDYAHGSLWFAGNHGLFEFNLKEKEWFLLDKKHGLPGDTVYDLYVHDDQLFLEVRDWGDNDFLSDARHYLYTRNGYRKTKRSLDDVRAGGSYTTKNSDLRHNRINDVLRTDGYTWIASSAIKDGGVYRLRPVSKRGRLFTPNDGISHGYCYALARTDDGKIWVTHWEEERGISVLEKGQSRWKVIKKSREGIELGGVRVESEGRYLFITQHGGLVIYDTVSEHAYRVDQPSGMPGYVVSHLYVDQNRNLWVTAYTFGRGGQTKAGVIKLAISDIDRLFGQIRQEYWSEKLMSSPHG